MNKKGKNNKHTITFIDLFAGAGGLSEGFLQEGYSPIAFIEKDASACLTLKTRLAYFYLQQTNKLDIYYKYLKKEITRNELYAQIPENILSKVIYAEINTNTIDSIFEQIDTILQAEKTKLNIIIGGPPCQAYSSIAPIRLSKETLRTDPRLYLFRFYLQFLKKYQPDFFVFENVPGLLLKRNSDYLSELLDGLQKQNYNIQYNLLNLSDYGVAQHRKRVFIYGSLQKYDDFSFLNIKKNLITNYSLKDLFSDLPTLKQGEQKHIAYYTKEANEYLQKSYIRTNEPFTTQHAARKVNDNDIEIYKLAIQKFLKTKKQIKYSELPSHLKKYKNETYEDRFKVLNLYGLSHTIMAHLAKSGHYYIYPNVKTPRALSIREAARIQSFPDNYFFEGSMSSCFRQIGNAVPPLFSYHIAKYLEKYYNNS